MSDEADPEEYLIEGDEHTFIKTIALEYAMIIMFRKILRDKYDNEEIKSICSSMIKSAKIFNNDINSENDPQSIAWNKQLDTEFNRIFAAIESDDSSWEQES